MYRSSHDPRRRGRIRRAISARGSVRSLLRRGRFHRRNSDATCRRHPGGPAVAGDWVGVGRVGPAAASRRSAAGGAGGVGVALLYHALASGTMSVVAPTTAVAAVAIPVISSIALGERPGWLAVVGILLGIASIALVSRQTKLPTEQGQRSGLGAALAAGVAIGLFLLALA